MYSFENFVLLGQSDSDAAAAGAVIATVVVVFLVTFVFILAIGVGISALICWFLASALDAVPAQFRAIQVGSIWLLMIPIFSVFWAFTVFPGISKSFRSFLHAVGRHDAGDCGEQIGMWYAMCGALAFVPGLGGIAGPAGLVLLILYLAQIHALAGQVRAGGFVPPQPHYPSQSTFTLN